PSNNRSGSRRIATGRAAGLSAQRPCWQNPAHRSPRLRSMWDSMARAHSALPFIGSLGKHLPTIAATLNDAGHDRAPPEAARRASARLPLLRLPRLESGLIDPGGFMVRGIRWTNIYTGEVIAPGLITGDMSGTNEGRFRIQIGQLDQ